MNFSGKIRFAPSPTGYLHQGHLLSALYVWAAAKKWNLHIHLRIENHDSGRSRDTYINSIYEDLEWLGFKYHSQSIQSHHKKLYHTAIEKLQEAKLIYPCTCSRKQLELENPKSPSGEIIYQGKCRNSPPEISLLKPHSLRFKTTNKVIKWTDKSLGTFFENPFEQCGDFPLMDREGNFTYQLCACVDDLNQGITHIVRGKDLLTSTARQILLSQTLCNILQGIENIPSKYFPPLYLHHPLITDASGKKLSKREFSHSLRQDKEEGLTPETLFGQVLFKAGFIPQETPTPLNNALEILVNRI